VLSSIIWMAQLVSELYFGPVSRRIANVPYVLSMVSFNTFNLACFLMVQLASLVGWAARMPHFSPDESPFERVQPCLLEAVNRQGLLFFLAANLGTGIVNAMFRTLDMDTTWTTVILMVYAFLLSLLVQIRRGGELEVKRQ